MDAFSLSKGVRANRKTLIKQSKLVFKISQNSYAFNIYVCID